MTKKLIEDEDLELDGVEVPDDDISVLTNERKLHTQALDLSVQTLVEQWGNNTLILPEIQREYVWDNGKASRLIESLLLNIPIPVLYFAETAQAKYEIIDGHQRVSSIARFLGNEFKLSGLAVLREYKNCQFHKLPEREQRFLKMRTLRVIIISVESHPNMKFEVFERLNTGAISLNAQELRNSIYRGPFNQLLRELAKNKTFREILGSKNPRKRMVDEELILRFFALRGRLGTYRPSLKRFLNNYMGDVQKLDPGGIAGMRELFEHTIEAVRRHLGRYAFRVMDSSGKPTESAINRAIFDAQMLAASWSVFPDDLPSRAAVKEVAELYKAGDFMDAIQRATGDRTRILKRLKETVQAFERSGAQVSVPFDLEG